MQYIKDSFRELRHVVWPTKAETKQYFMMVFWALFLFAIFLFLLSATFGNLINFLKINLSGL